MKLCLTKLFLVIFSFGFFYSISKAQTFPIPGGLVIPGTQTCFPFTISGAPIWPIYDPLTYPGPWPYPNPISFIDQVCIDIQTSHPWTLEITLVSPAGTVLTLSSFNGAGGTNYTNTCFTSFTADTIIGVPAPFTGSFLPQQNPPGFSIFNGQSLNGVWQLCILDTLTDSTFLPPGGPPGVGATSTATGTMAVGATCDFNNTYPPPISDNTFAACGTPVNLDLYYAPPPGVNVTYYDWTWNTIGPGVSLPGTYYVVWEDACWAQIMPGMYTSMATVTLVGTQAALGPDQTVSNCQGVTTDLNSLFNLTGMTYQWDFNGVPITSAAAATVTLPGIYQIIGSTSSTCNDTALVTITIVPSPNVGPDQIITGCPVAPFDLTPLFNTTGLITNWTLNGNPIGNPSAVSVGGNYMLVATDPTGCSDTAIVNIGFTPVPVLGPDQTIDFCGTVSVNLTSLYITTGLTASWSLNGVPVANPASVNVVGLYTLIASTPNGCADTAMVILNQLPTPALGPDQTVIGCTVAPYDLTLLYNTTSLTANWYRNGVLVPNPAAVTINGNYMLVAENASGCKDTAIVSLNLSIGPVLGPDQSVSICTGGTINLTTLYGTGSYTNNWTLGGNPVLNPSAVSIGGVYTLISSNTNGCADTALVTLTVTSPPSLGPDQVVNNCANATINLTSVFNTTGLSSSWTFNSSPVSNPLSVTSAGIYTIVVTNAGGCTDQAIVTLNTLPSPNLGANQNAAFCPGATVDLTGYFTTTGYTNYWSLNGTPVANPAAINVAGSYQLISVDPVYWCSDTALIIVSASSYPIPGPDQQVAGCNGSTVNLTGLFNTVGCTVVWTLNGTTVSNPGSITTAGNYQMTCTNSSGCSATAVATVTMNAAPILGSDQSLAACDGVNLDLTGLFSLSGYNTVWSVSGNPIQDPTAINQSGSYQVIAINSNGCNDTALALVTIYDLPSIGPDQSHELCPWMTVDLNLCYVTNAIATTWSYNGQVIPVISLVYDPGTYQITVADTNGCTNQAVVTISNIECVCEADFSFDGHCMQEPVQFIALADSLILNTHWKFSHPGMQSTEELNPQVIIPTDESIVVTLEAVLSCGTRIIEKNVVVEDCAETCPVFFPSAFTPNKDGINDEFRSYTECTPLDFQMDIWNRFGQLIFSSDDITKVWNGNDENGVAQNGVYVVRINYHMPYQAKKTIHDLVSITR